MLATSILITFDHSSQWLSTLGKGKFFYFAPNGDKNFAINICTFTFGSPTETMGSKWEKSAFMN
jgi:hypothetical protein